MLIGYARVSTPEQNIDSQIDNLKKAGCQKIYSEVVSGVKSKKKALEDALQYLREGDTLVVWRLDRLGRTLNGLMKFMTDLEERDIHFKSLTESIDTSTTTGKFFFQITGAFAELERNLIKERTKAGLESARSRGRLGGRPKALDEETFHMAYSLYKNNSCSVETICRKFSISKRTFYRYLENYKGKSSVETISGRHTLMQ